MLDSDRSASATTPLAVGTAFPHVAVFAAAPNNAQYKAGQWQAIASQSEVAFPSADDWTQAAPTQALFVVLTLIAIPWFVARVLRRFGWLQNGKSPGEGRAETSGTRKSAKGRVACRSIAAISLLTRITSRSRKTSASTL